MTPLQIFDVVYLLILLALLVALVVNAFLKNRRDEKILKILMEVSAKNAQSAELAVKATQDAITLLKEAAHGYVP